MLARKAVAGWESSGRPGKQWPARKAVADRESSGRPGKQWPAGKAVAVTALVMAPDNCSYQGPLPGPSRTVPDDN
jgi:hypothetical protein